MPTISTLASRRSRDASRPLRSLPLVRRALAFSTYLPVKASPTFAIRERCNLRRSIGHTAAGTFSVSSRRAMNSLKGLFLEHVAQTSGAPIGLEISHAQGSWLYCRDGRRYLDFVAGIGVSALGHGHPVVLRAIEEQARRHLHVMVYGEYVIEAQVKLATRLSELLPRGLSRVYFTNSGAEAIEAALKLARKRTRRAGFVAFDGAYHGDTLAALALMGNPAFRAPFEPLPGPVRHLPYDDVAALDAVDKTIAAVVIEPVQAEGGVRIPSARFMQTLRKRCVRVG